MPTLKARTLLSAAALLLGVTTSLQAQLEVGTWVRRVTPATPGDVTMTIETCCDGGRRLTYHMIINGATAIMTVDSPLDGTVVPVLLDGKPSGETMAITRVDAHHATTVLTLNAAPFGTSQATLSADGKTITVVNDFSVSVGGNPAGKFTETWVRQ